MKSAIAKELILWTAVAMLCVWAQLPVFGQDTQDCIDATCRIVAGDGGCGTGTVIEDAGDHYRILTNAHVAGRNDSRVSVEFWKDGYASGQIQGRVLASWLIDNEDRDIAIVSVPKSSLTLPLTPIPLAEDGVQINSRTILSVGCANGSWPTAWRGHITGSDRPNVVEFVPAPAGGRSGSALFVPVGGEMRVAGLVAWRSDEENCGIAMHLGAIQSTYNGRTLTGWHPTVRKAGRTWAPRHMVQCGPDGCDPWQGGGQPYQQPRPQQPSDPHNPWFGGKQILPDNNPSDGAALLPWREGIEKKIAELESKCTAGGNTEKIKAEIIAEVRLLIQASGCNCDHSQQVTIEQVNQAIATAVAKIEAKPGPMGPQGPPGKDAAAKPFYLRVHPSAPYQSVSPGQYVTLPLDKVQAQQ